MSSNSREGFGWFQGEKEQNPTPVNRKKWTNGPDPLPGPKTMLIQKEVFFPKKTASPNDLPPKEHWFEPLKRGNEDKITVLGVSRSQIKG